MENRAEIIGETTVPGATVKEVAERHGLPPSRLYNWRWRALNGDIEVPDLVHERLDRAAAARGSGGPTRGGLTNAVRARAVGESTDFGAQVGEVAARYGVSRGALTEWRFSAMRGELEVPGLVRRRLRRAFGTPSVGQFRPTARHKAAAVTRFFETGDQNDTTRAFSCAPADLKSWIRQAAEGRLEAEIAPDVAELARRAVTVEKSRQDGKSRARDAVERGEDLFEVADRFGVSYATVFRWAKEAHERRRAEVIDEAG